jgi:hypothetical protein
MYLLDDWIINITGTNYPTIIWYLPKQYPLSISYPSGLLSGPVLYSSRNLIRFGIGEKYIR